MMCLQAVGEHEITLIGTIMEIDLDDVPAGSGPEWDYTGVNNHAGDLHVCATENIKEQNAHTGRIYLQKQPWTAAVEATISSNPNNGGPGPFDCMCARKVSHCRQHWHMTQTGVWVYHDFEVHSSYESKS